MKVFTNGKVYVQNNDLQYLLKASDGISIPYTYFDFDFKPYETPIKSLSLVRK